MKLQTQITVTRQQYNQIDYNSKLLLLGSCFADNIFNKLTYHKFNVEVNPFGIQFHNYGIERLVTRAINQEYYTTDELRSVDEIFYSFDAHSQLNSERAEELIEKLNNQLDHTLNWLKNSSHMVITLGTSWVYRHISTDSMVSNCHKVPQKEFLKELLPLEAISESLDSVITLVRSINPKVSFIFTVSPIRHLKDGLVENNRSKAHLLAAVHEVVDSRKAIYYFPSYEIQMDELRDYRFYDVDMLHPSQQAIDIIWDRFAATWLTEEALRTKAKVENIQKGLNHRPFKEDSKSYQVFKENLKMQINALQQEYPQIKF